MELIRFKDHAQLSGYVAGEVVTALQKKPSLTICLASGHTPALACELLVEQLLQQQVNYSGLFLLGLDEWVGLGAETEGGCQHFFRKKLVEPLQLRETQYHFFNALNSSLEQECAGMDAVIAQRGPIDIMIVGIGMNGHIGFNEPGTPFTSLSHSIQLAEITKTIGKKYFTGNVPLEKGITIGLGHLMNSHTVYLMANGAQKAGVIQQAVTGPVSPSFPASIMQIHGNGFVLVDEEAGTLV